MEANSHWEDIFEQGIGIVSVSWGLWHGGKELGVGAGEWKQTHIGIWKDIFKQGIGIVSVLSYAQVKHRYALNLSCEKAESLYAAFWMTGPTVSLWLM